MTDNTNVKSDVSPHLRETYLRKWDISSFSRRFPEIGIEPQFIQAIRLILLTTQRQPCCVRDVVNNILEQFFKANGYNFEEEM